AAALLTLAEEGANRDAARHELDEAWLGLEGADTLAASGMKIAVRGAVEDGSISDEELARIAKEGERFPRPDGLTDEVVAERLAAFETEIAEQMRKHPPRRPTTQRETVRATGKLGSLAALELSEAMAADGWTERRCRQREDEGELDLRCSWEKDGAVVSLEAMDLSDAEDARDEATDQREQGAAVAVDGKRLLVIVVHDGPGEHGLIDQLCPDDCQLRETTLLRQLPDQLRKVGAKVGDCSVWSEEGESSQECRIELVGQRGWVEVLHRDDEREDSERRTQRYGGTTLDQGDAELKVALLNPVTAQRLLTTLIDP
ncbi:MAG: hypothetical protein KC621_06650, partial [Myxococcales bacterium]|nr:hypothetical protein [Myxococcales bacterium]